MIKPSKFLSAVASYVKQYDIDSSDRPNKIAVIDPSLASGSITAKVTFEGESTLSFKSYPCIGSYAPRAGERVVMVPVGKTYLIVGTVGSAGYYSAKPNCSLNIINTSQTVTLPNSGGGGLFYARWNNAIDVTDNMWNANQPDPSRININTAGLYKISASFCIATAAGGQTPPNGIKTGHLINTGGLTAIGSATVWDQKGEDSTTIAPLVTKVSAQVRLNIGDGVYLAPFWSTANGTIYLTSFRALNHIEVEWMKP